MDFFIGCIILIIFITLATYLFVSLVFIVEKENLKDDIKEVLKIVNSNKGRIK